VKAWRNPGSSKKTPGRSEGAVEEPIRDRKRSTAARRSIGADLEGCGPSQPRFPEYLVFVSVLYPARPRLRPTRCKVSRSRQPCRSSAYTFSRGRRGTGTISSDWRFRRKFLRIDRAAKQKSSQNNEPGTLILKRGAQCGAGVPARGLLPVPDSSAQGVRFCCQRARTQSEQIRFHRPNRLISPNPTPSPTSAAIDVPPPLLNLRTSQLGHLSRQARQVKCPMLRHVPSLNTI
jgi:hypothetical protein